MSAKLDEVQVIDNTTTDRFEARMDGRLAVIEYMRSGDTIVFTHTEVPEELEGHGLAAKMARTALEQARAQYLVVVPMCPFVASYIRRHQEYLDLVHPEYHQLVTRS